MAYNPFGSYGRPRNAFQGGVYKGSPSGVSSSTFGPKIAAFGQQQGGPSQQISPQGTPQRLPSYEEAQQMSDYRNRITPQGTQAAYEQNAPSMQVAPAPQQQITSSDMYGTSIDQSQQMGDYLNRITPQGMPQRQPSYEEAMQQFLHRGQRPQNAFQGGVHQPSPSGVSASPRGPVTTSMAAPAAPAPTIPIGAPATPSAPFIAGVDTRLVGAPPTAEEIKKRNLDAEEIRLPPRRTPEQILAENLARREASLDEKGQRRYAAQSARKQAEEAKEMALNEGPPGWKQGESSFESHPNERAKAWAKDNNLLIKVGDLDQKIEKHLLENPMHPDDADMFRKQVKQVAAGQYNAHIKQNYNNWEKSLEDRYLNNAGWRNSAGQYIDAKTSKQNARVFANQVKKLNRQFTDTFKRLEDRRDNAIRGSVTPGRRSSEENNYKDEVWRQAWYLQGQLKDYGLLDSKGRIPPEVGRSVMPREAWDSYKKSWNNYVDSFEPARR